MEGVVNLFFFQHRKLGEKFSVEFYPIQLTSFEVLLTSLSPIIYLNVDL